MSPITTGGSQPASRPGWGPVPAASAPTAGSGATAVGTTTSVGTAPGVDTGATATVAVDTAPAALGVPGSGAARDRVHDRRSRGRWAAFSRRGAGIRAGQLVTGQVAVAVVLAALGRGTPVTVAALLVAALLVAVAGVRVRGRWLFEWLGTAAGHVTRRRVLGQQPGPAELLALVAPGAVVHSTELSGGPAAVLEDTGGMVALLELGDPGDLLGDASRAIPAPAALLPTPGPDVPPLRIQLLLSGTPAPVPTAGGTVGTSYRQLTDGRLAGRERAVLAVRVLRADGWTQEALRRALAGTVRRIVRRLGPLTARPLGVPAALRVLGELAHHDGQPVRESWPLLRSGALVQATFRLVDWPQTGAPAARRLVPRLLALPATATTVSLCVGPPPAAGTGTAPTELAVRLAAASTAELTVAVDALGRLVSGVGGTLRRLDGAHLTGLAGTLPVALTSAGGQSAVALDDWELPLGEAGMMVGTNRHGGAVTVRLFRPESTRVMLVGGVRAAQLVALRAMALGALVVVQTARPRVWEPFVRGVGAPGGTIPLIPPGRPVADSVGTALQPLLLVVDAGPAPAETEPGPAWRATLVVRDELTPADVDALSRADLAVLQPLHAAEAALAGAALGLGGSADWLTRIRDDMVAVVNRRALRWALLSPTPIEAQLIGRPARG
ncbi:type VII secretion protein EccE [Micromonospora sp. NPDC005237]|uniref:type VII secretion protein EccE n=1 Tax=Micromonospora sp. NPDC005237 TaxID=3155113 RepID=UPI0033A19540